MLAEPLKSLGEKRKNAQNRKEVLEKEKGKEIQKGKEKKIRVPWCFYFLGVFFLGISLVFLLILQGF